MNLCDTCSKEKGVQDPTGFALADLLLALSGEEIEKVDQPRNVRSAVYASRFQEDWAPWLQCLLRHFQRSWEHYQGHAQGD